MLSTITLSLIASVGVAASTPAPSFALTGITPSGHELRPEVIQAGRAALGGDRIVLLGQDARMAQDGDRMVLLGQDAKMATPQSTLVLLGQDARMASSEAGIVLLGQDARAAGGPDSIVLLGTDARSFGSQALVLLGQDAATDVACHIEIDDLDPGLRTAGYLVDGLGGCGGLRGWLAEADIIDGHASLRLDAGTTLAARIFDVLVTELSPDDFDMAAIDAAARKAPGADAFDAADLALEADGDCGSLRGLAADVCAAIY